MRITIATGPLLPVPALQGGAIPRLWQGLAEQFAKRGHAVTICARTFEGQPATEVIRGVEYQRWGGFAQSLSVKWDLVKDLGYAAGLLRRLPPGDILVTNDFWLPTLAAAIRPSVGRVVVNANRFPKGQFRLYRRAARIAAASNSVRDAVIAQCPVLADRTRVFPNPIDTELLCPAGSKEARTCPPVLLFVGRLHPEKGIHLLVEAFAKISPLYPNWRLRLVGPHLERQGGGGEAYRERLRSIAGTAPVQFVGPVFDHAALAVSYQEARLFCYPSTAEHGEALPVAPLEAMACGVPVIVSDLSCFRDYVVMGESGWFFDHRIQPVRALAAVLERVLCDPQRLASASRHAHQTAQRFGFVQVADDYLADFARMVSDR